MTYQESRGDEPYRGHVLRKFMVSRAGVQFWRVEIEALGLRGVPLAVAQDRKDHRALADTVQQAKRIVGNMIFYGTNIAAVNVPERYLAGRSIDAMVPMSGPSPGMGSPGICAPHWNQVKANVKIGGVNPLVFVMKLSQELGKYMATQGLVLVQNGKVGMSLAQAIGTYGPYCCLLGETVFDKVMADSNPKVILERAAQAGLT